ncbi:hypothetical protein DRW03_00160 [Corallococcus sp. H22C18031201]|uniref:hypothetical protein n=1 Tax=Citreicoccus inhibens TaxID=2849499 RepID=UPI000E724472|nr:hypothetical protein [Citreicoccus inhibens]MBU8899938.1 hypothetical protein [Citreicoccus inhibens]RJS27931.1 hypothetical protein DRW03_00160 [Corallococcus sp. H22C18031201]
MPYQVRTPDGELTYPTLGDVEQAYVQGLISPEDEVREEGASAWRHAGSIPALANARDKTQELLARRAQIYTVGLGVLMGTVAAILLLRGHLYVTSVIGIVLAFLTASLFTRVAYRAYVRPGAPATPRR